MARREYPSEGRRKWRLRAVEEFWKLGSLDDVQRKVAKLREGDLVAQDFVAPWMDDTDPFDPVPTPLAAASEKGSEDPLPALRSGMIVRADFSDEEAWRRFRQVLEESEREGWEAVEGGANAEDSDSDEDDNEDEDGMDVDETGEGHKESDSPHEEPTSRSSPTEGLSLFRIVDSPSSLLTNASNLSILRTVVDVSIISAPQPPVTASSSNVYMQVPKAKRAPLFTWMKDNPLVNKWGLREVYYDRDNTTRACSRTETEGMQPQVIVWVYDTQSNVDGSVRLVSTGAEYGGFTGDSWRARGSHVWDLQYNLVCGNVSSIGFGGGPQDYDRYSWDERKRNFAEVGIQIA